MVAAFFIMSDIGERTGLVVLAWYSSTLLAY